ncbi:hypothetical protein KBB27_01850 [Patescibacteria group bacterium]|nr:hypothetical protein [Patescibacteria group bacterium]
MSDRPFPKEMSPESANTFSSLRKRLHARMGEELQERLRLHPEPTEEEIWLGAYKEELEPQVRDAIFALRQKGYDTTTSGFMDESGRLDCQHLGGYFDLPPEIVEELNRLGVRVVRDKKEMTVFSRPEVPVTYLYFRALSPDSERIKEQWERIVDLFPTLSPLKKPSRIGAYWRSQHVPERFDLARIDLEQRLDEERLSPQIRERLETRLKQIELMQELTQGEPSPKRREAIEQQLKDIERYFDLLESDE